MLRKKFVAILCLAAVFALAGCGGNSFVGIWTGDAEDPWGYGASALAIFTSSNWMVMVPEEEIELRGAYTVSGNTATIHSRGSVNTASISGGTLMASFNDLGTVTLKKARPLPLNAGKWVDGVFDAATRDIVYSFNIENGTTYYVWTNDGWEGDDSKTCDIYFIAFDENTVYGYGDDHWRRAFQFTAESRGRVYIAVAPYSPDHGTFAIAYTTTPTRP